MRGESEAGPSALAVHEHEGEADGPRREGSASPSARPGGPTEADNAPLWDGARRAHYEVWYLTVNHRASRTGFWIRFTLDAPAAGHGEPYGRVWFAFFDAQDPARGFALNRRYARAELGLVPRPFEVRMGSAALHHDGTWGEVAGQGHHARWDLSWEPSSWSHRHLPDLVYRSGFADTRVLSPNPDLRVRGLIEADGRRLELDGEPGGQSHLWGRKHAHSWAWGRCSAFEGGAPALLETLTVRVRRAGIVLPPLTLLALYLDGEPLRFTSFRSLLQTRGRFERGRYAFSARSRDVVLEGEFAAAPGSMVLAEYADPDAEPCWCANTEVGNLALSVRRRVAGAAWEERRLVARGTAHFEVAGREPDAAVGWRHVAV